MICWHQHPSTLFREKIKADTESVHNQPQRRRLILNFARDREGDSSGEAEMEHQERNDTVDEPDDVPLRAACPSLHSRVRQFGRS